MKYLRTLALTAVSMMALTACNGTKTTYEKFHEKALAAEKSAEGKTLVGATVNSKGDYRQSGVTIDLTGTAVFNLVDGELKLDEEKSSIKNIVAALNILAALVITAGNVSEDQNMTYYINPLSTSYKDESGLTSKTSYDKYGRLTKTTAKGDTANYTLTAKWTWK